MERGISKATENELLVNAARYQVESHFGALLSHNNPNQHQQRHLPLAPSPESAAEYSSHEEAVSADTPDRDDAIDLELKSVSRALDRVQFKWNKILAELHVRPKLQPDRNDEMQRDHRPLALVAAAALLLGDDLGGQRHKQRHRRRQGPLPQRQPRFVMLQLQTF